MKERSLKKSSTVSPLMSRRDTDWENLLIFASPLPNRKKTMFEEDIERYNNDDQPEDWNGGDKDD